MFDVANGWKGLGRSLLCSASLLALAAGMGGCRSKELPRDLELPPDVRTAMADPQREGAATPGMAINVYVDGSQSTERFLHLADNVGKGAPQVAGGTNYLRVLLDRIGPAMGTEPAWHGHPLQFWRFGGKVPAKLPASDIAEMSNHPDHRQFPELDTKIEVPFAQGSPAVPELKIVITDLYQSDLHLGDLGSAIAGRYLRPSSAQKGAVSILAVRNPFYGRAQDLPGHQAAKPYATSMPFYVIVSGPAADVRFATKMLMDRAGLRDAFADGKANLFYFAAQQNVVLTSAPEMSGTGKYHLINEDYEGSHLPFYTLKGGTLQLQWPEPSPSAWLGADATTWAIAPVALASLRPSAEIYGLGKSNPNKSEVDADAAQSVTQCPAGGDCVSVDGLHLLRGFNYLFRVNRVEKPSDNFRSRSEALKPWSIEMQEAQALSAVPDSRFARLNGIADASPGRTPDLSNFLTALQGEIFPDSSSAAVSHYYFFVHVN